MTFTKENAAYYGKMGGLKGGSKGGKNGSHDDKVRAGQLGFEATCISHPFFARKYLQFQPGMNRSPVNKAKKRQAAMQHLLVQSKHIGKRQPMNKKGVSK